MHLSDLPRHWARRVLATAQFCTRGLDTDLRQSSLVVAYSTGLDSTVLLHLLHLLAPQLKLTLHAAHAHHGLRQASDQEEQIARQVCASLNIPLHIHHLYVPAAARQRATGLEETARDLRYAFFETVRQDCQADWIATAHHADDLAEDIVLRLLRGTGWPGLGGMVGVDPKRCLLRPLLAWEKSDLRALAQDLNLTWCEDASNANHLHTRNRVRQQIIPLLRAENPAFAAACRRLWQTGQRDAAFWQAQMPELPHNLTSYLLKAQDLDQAHPALRLRLYKHVLDHLGPGQVLGEHLFRLDQCWQKGLWRKTIQFPGNKSCRVEKQGVTISRQSTRG